MGVTSSNWGPALYTGTPSSSRTVAGAGTGKRAVRNLDGAAPDVQRRRDDVVDAEPLHREHDADDVDDGVDGADFVQVNLVDRHVVDRGLGLAEALEQRLGAGLPRRRQRRVTDEVRDLAQRAMAVVASDCACARGRAVAGMVVSVIVTMPVIVGVLVIVLVIR